MEQLKKIVKLVNGYKVYLMCLLGAGLVIIQIAGLNVPHISWVHIWQLWALAFGAAGRSALAKLQPDIQGLMKIAMDVAASKTITNQQIKDAEADIKCLEKDITDITQKPATDAPQAIPGAPAAPVDVPAVPQEQKQ